MAIVYHCVDLRNAARQVAVKTIHPHRDVDHLEKLICDRELNVKDLKHENIVDFVDYGTQSDGSWYLVYEWLPEDLKSWIARQRDLGADDLVESIGLPVLQALSAAHERQISHRDVKPSNVMMSDVGVPKLTDFGISKVRYQIDGHHTLVGASSKPFTPPLDDSASGERRDVFSFGVLMLWALTYGEIDVQDYSDFDTALESLDATPELVNLLGQCISFDQHERPASAVELLAALSSYQQNRQKHWVKKRTVFLHLKHSAIAAISEKAEIPDSDVPQLVETELREEPAIRLLTGTNSRQRPGEKHAFAYGHLWSFRLAFIPGEPLVEVLGAKPISENESDSRKDSQFVADNWHFRCGAAPNHSAAADSASDLIDAVEVFDSDRAISQQQREEQRLFDQWKRQLDAREAADANREDRVRYTSVQISGQRAKFTLQEGIEGFSVEQRRCVLNENARTIAFGEVEWIEGNEVDIYLDNEPGSGLPPKGNLALDTVATKEVIRRERLALNAIRFAGPQLRRADLPALLIQPADVQPLTKVDSVSWSNDEIDESKRSAVRGALGSKDFFVVQGPPGTGKTAFIAELVAQEIRRKPGARILLASQTNVALDNALERLRKHRDKHLRLLRLGNAAEGKISASVTDLTLDRQLDLWRASVRQRSEQYLDSVARKEGVELTTLKTIVLLNELASVLEEAATVRAEINDLETMIAVGAGIVGSGRRMTTEELQLAQEDCDALRQRRSQLDRDARRLRDTKAVARKLKGLASHEVPVVRRAADDLLHGATTDSRLSELVRLQSRWLEHLGRRPEFEAALLAASHVVAGTCVGMARTRGIQDTPFDLCILDEASKATATESLIPMVRASRWVLVGDERQLPPQLDDALRDKKVVSEFQLDLAESSRTIFSRLAAALPKENSVALTTQYRMVPAIGKLISECFYGGALSSHPLDPPWDLSLLQPSHVTWFSTESIKHRHEKQFGPSAPSYVNLAEAKAILKHLERLNFVLQSKIKDGKPVKVLVLAPYRLQVAHITKGVDGLRQSCKQLEIEVGTVDAVQGREADILLFSAVRSNLTKEIGFVRDIARANVALSRARYSLTIYGDAAFFDQTDSPLQKVLSYIRRNPQECSLETLKP